MKKCCWRHFIHSDNGQYEKNGSHMPGKKVNRFYDRQRESAMLTLFLLRCVNGYLLEDLTCTCHPCWDGNTCETYGKFTQVLVNEEF